MTIKNMVFMVLKESGRSMHINEIARMLIETGLWITSSLDPATTIGVELFRDIKKYSGKSRFVKTAPGTYAIQESRDSELSEEAPKTKAFKPLFSYTECARMVLEKFSGGKPMHYKEITKIAQDEGWLVRYGKKPAIAMTGLVLKKIKRQKMQGVQPCFVSYGKGYVGLSKFNFSQPVPGTPDCFLKHTWKKEGYSFADCTEKVLLEYSNGQTMHYRDITEKAIKKGWLVTKVKWPEISLHAHVSYEIRSQKKRGVQPRFVMHGGGYISLSKINVSPSGHDESSRSEDQPASALLHSAETAAADRPSPDSARAVLRPRLRKSRSSSADCAEKVLLKYSNGQPMHYLDITRKALENGWLVPKEKIYERSERAVYDTVLHEIKRCEKNGVQPRFVMPGGGFVGLSKFEASPPVLEGPGSSEVQPPSPLLGSGETADDSWPDLASAGDILNPRSVNAGYFVIDCAEKVLLEYSEGNPMSCQEIIKIALENGWLPADRKISEHSLYLKVFYEIRRQQKQGDQPKFVLCGSGFVGLSKFNVTPPVLEGPAGSEVQPASPLPGCGETAEDARPDPASAGDVSNSRSENAGYFITDCAEKVLLKYNKGRPMSCREIIKKALDNGWLPAGGKTSEHSLYLKVFYEIKRQKKIGVQPRFVLYGSGFVGLSKTNVTPPVLEGLAGSEVQPASELPAGGETAEDAQPAPASAGDVSNPRPENAGYSIIGCVAKVLEEFSAGQPMSCRKITLKALDKGWLVTDGKISEDSIFDLVFQEIKHHQKMGGQPHFVVDEDGFVGLSKFNESPSGHEGDFGSEVQPASALPDFGETAEDARPDPSSAGDVLNPISENAGYSLTECAWKVLSKYSEDQKMHYIEIFRKALENGWLVKKEKISPKYLYNQVLDEIKRHKNRGAQPRFIMYGDGFLGLSKFTVSPSVREDPGTSEAHPASALLDFGETAEVVRPDPGSASDVSILRSDNAGYSIIGCVIKVLEELSPDQLITCRVITEKALEKGLLMTEGKMSEDFIFDLVLCEIRRHQKSGDQPHFDVHDGGIAGFSKFNETPSVHEETSGSESQPASALLDCGETAEDGRPDPGSASDVSNPRSENTGYSRTDSAAEVLPEISECQTTAGKSQKRS
ncbi:MAG: winged helix-turn-helix domain-containing protein [Deltaproteobacteria bacterium]|jgi:hypothetical protein|nr:winged helix-turn-helix domain-containing protein [Deltaproteobacteria bacterium]